MKYTTQITIHRPRDQVAALFTNSDRYGEWQESLVSQERLEGAPGQEGTRTKLLHNMGKREIEMLETVTRQELPERFVATYEAKGVWNEADNRFHANGASETTWVMETEFRCTGFMWLLTTFAPGMFKKETLKTMNAFKAFVENPNTRSTPSDA